MRYILFFSLPLTLFANTLCKTCHPTIYNEYKGSMHFKSTLERNPLHKAIWDKHPLKASNSYKCAKCHNPKVEHKVQEGVDCISCHKIKDIQEHSRANQNIYEKKAKLFYSKDNKQRDKVVRYHKENSFFGLFTKTTGSPYHDIDYTNTNYYTGRVCMGCHSHLKNKAGLMLCQTPKEGASNEKQNCITCHMPQVLGSATTIKKTKTHAYHGFLGAYNKPSLLAKYIDLDVTKKDNKLIITLTNNSPHPLFTHPMRVVRLHIALKDKNKTVLNKNIDFARVLGKDNKVSSPALATTVLKDTMLKAHEKRVITLEAPKFTKGEAIVGYFKVTSKVAQKLNIKDKDLTEFVELKKMEFKH